MDDFSFQGSNIQEPEHRNDSESFSGFHLEAGRAQFQSSPNFSPESLPSNPKAPAAHGYFSEGSVRVRLNYLESMSILEKYKLALAKIYSAAAKLHCISKNKEMLKMQKAFTRLKVNSKPKANKEPTKEIIEKVKRSIKGIIQIREVRQQAILQRFVWIWLDAVTKSKKIKEVKKKLSAAEEKLKKQLNAKIQSIATLEKTHQKQAQEMDELRKTDAKLKEALKEKEMQENALKSALAKATKENIHENTRVSDSKFQALQLKLLRLEGENKELKMQIKSTESDVNRFLREVNEVFDTYDSTSNITILTVESDLEDVFVDNRIELAKAGAVKIKKPIGSKYKLCVQTTAFIPTK
eukprot:TRINITY_DN6156_c0_g2_i1.p1 TRINITY_DN6156_c0_g2~~TRINITY_DN6156_c0_g2_i1.p1  ORF type:complete len:353 (-),score=71.60 TRINITY_DN6156_c0_g2_i1:97-1155(-)